MGYTLHVHTAGGGKGYPLRVHIAGGGKEYILNIHISIFLAVERGAPCVFTLLAVEMDTYTLKGTQE